MAKVTIDFDLADFYDYEDVSASDALRQEIFKQVRKEILNKTGTNVVQEIHEQVKQYVETTFKKEVTKYIKKEVKNFKLTLNGKDYTIEEWIKNRFEYQCSCYEKSNFAKEIEILSKGLIDNCFEEFKKAKKQQIIEEFELRFAERMSNK